MTRRLWVLIHRYAGLAMTVFLVIVGLTGSLLAFYHEADGWLNPEFLTVPVREGPMLDPFTLGERAEALEPRARIDYAPLAREPGESYTVWLSAKTDPATGKDYELSYNQLLLDPYTGEKLGARKWGEVSLAKENILSFLYQLHMTLALPETMGSLGGYLLGITALVWTIDCFIGFYLTLPPGRRRPPPNLPLRKGEGKGYKSPPCEGGDLEGVRQRSWWQRWKPAWLIKKRRFNYDLHRASGLWVWPMLFVLAWSSVALNLREVYSPVMKTFFTLRNAEELPALDPPLESPALGWREAHAQGQRLMQEAASQHRFTIVQEQGLWLDRAHGVYYYNVKSSEDWGSGGTSVLFDADTGAFERLTLPATEASGDVVTRWLVWLHTARVFGMPMQIFVCVMGLVITALSVTGVIIWLRKRHAAKSARSRRIETPHVVATDA